MPEMRKCKECGKLFVPKGREQYCSDIHYRPCPICGKPVEAKYLSDPPRKCADCKGSKKNPISNTGFQEISMKPKALFSFGDKPQPKVAEQKVSEPKVEEVELVSEVKPVLPDINQWADEIEIGNTDTIETAAFCEQQTGAVRMYIGKPFKNSFIPGHKYLLKVERDQPGAYSVWGVEDVTAESPVNILLPISSQTSFHRYFARVKEC